jgi:hypothetical protein
MLVSQFANYPRRTIMGVVGRVGIAAGLVCAATLAWGKQDVLYEEVPETGSNITRVAMTWPVTISATYAELSPEEREFVRGDYVKLGNGDEPAYPLYGMTPVLQEMQRIRMGSNDDGRVSLVVRVDAQGHARAFAILKAPDEGIAKAFAFVLMHTPFKPASCGGQACDSDYVFRYDFAHRKPSNFIVVNWDGRLWSDLVAKQPGL